MCLNLKCVIKKNKKMSKYKLIKKYPSLPNDWEVGMEVETPVGIGSYRIFSENHTQKSLLLT